MDLVIVKAVEYRAAGILQLFGPVDVVLLVKAGAQLDHGHDFLAVFCSGNQRIDDLRVAGHAVQRHFNGNDVRVRRSAQQHADERADALVWVGQQHIVLADLGVQVVPCRGLHGLGRRVEHGVVAAVAGQAAGIQRRGLGIAAIRRDDQLLPQELDDLLRSVRPELQAHSCQLAALFQQVAHDIAEVYVVVHHALVHGNIRIAGHAEEALLLYAAACKDGGGIVGNQLLHEGKAGLLAVLDEKHALKLAANGHDAIANAVVFAAQLGHVVNIFVVQKRERMAGVHDLRAEQGQQLTLEVGFPEMLLLLAELGKVHLAVALLRQSSDKMLEVFVALCLQLGHAGRDSSDLLRRRHVGDVIGLVVFHQRLVVQRADADHEELVHIAAEDGGKF